MEKWKCIILDDEDVDKLMVVSLAKRFSQLEIVGVFNDANQALLFLNDNHVDILFLDIDMPEMNGLAFREKVNSIPVCVFITGHAEHAVESFELDTLDFIVKPVKFGRFQKTVQRIEQFMEVKNKATLFEMNFGTGSIAIKENNIVINIDIKDILYLEALKDYTLLVTSQKKHCIWSNIGALLKKEEFINFTRVHRSYAVQKQYINNKTATTIFLYNGQEIPIGRSYKDCFN